MNDDFGDVARRALTEHGYSIRAASKAINYDMGYLSRVLSGKQSPSPNLAKAMDDLVGAQGALAGLVLNPDDRGRVARSTQHPSRVDAATVEALASVLSAYRRLDDTANPRTIIPATLAQMKEITGLLKRARGEHRDALAEVASEFAQFGGWMLAQVRRDKEAEALLGQALGIADDIGNGTLAAQALNFRGYITRQQGNHQGIARWFSAAALTPGAHPAQRIGDTLQAAAGFAALGELSRALHMVEEAERLTGKAAAVPPPGTAYWLTPEFNRINLGLSTLALRRYDEAVDHLTTGLAGLPAELQGALWTNEHREALKRAREAQ
ncbi:helix-turn-helix domain-containing protein [Streptomyces johnsoniae]|uniref:XRE family transcriptional regulator n=1 Tax=Streptomyces johnsoniae TaxID=3075532 RepID=A0ABU2S317_9ACTN|nr:helix-turn-helix domain-containing protein [Streptomyces sp. DSM 41886]MDT0443352.1 hypothetical protein [Streptomyces sp. DSM 41886]